jgi:hypothetical protein
MAAVIEAFVKAPRPGWTVANGSLPHQAEELKRRMLPEKAAAPSDDHFLPDKGDWWRVAAMVAAVLCGSALALYALIEWAVGR